MDLLTPHGDGKKRTKILIKDKITKSRELKEGSRAKIPHRTTIAKYARVEAVLGVHKAHGGAFDSESAANMRAVLDPNIHEIQLDAFDFKSASL